jgi:hypothetical protein
MNEYRDESERPTKTGWYFGCRRGMMDTIQPTYVVIQDGLMLAARPLYQMVAYSLDDFVWYGEVPDIKPGWMRPSDDPLHRRDDLADRLKE